MPERSRPATSAADVQFGEWLHGHIRDHFWVKRPDWVDDIAARLQSGRPQSDRRQVVVLWLSDMTAFTAPGRYIYVTGRLIEYCPGEAALAFTIGHELAHHDLGHIRFFPSWFRGVAANWITELVLLVVLTAEHVLTGPEREMAADRHALDLCTSAGYDPRECLRLFDQLEERLLDLGDLSGVYGPDDESDDELLPNASWMTKVRIWAWQRSRGYLPVRDRRRALQVYLAEKDRVPAKDPR